MADRLQVATVVQAGQVIATFAPAREDPVDVIVGEDAVFLIWPGSTLHTEIEYLPFELPLAGGQQVGILRLSVGERQPRLPLFMAEDIEEPGILWRLGRF